MKLKAIFKYLIYISLIILLIVLREYVEHLWKESFRRFFQFNYFYLIGGILITISIGVLLGMENFIRELRKKGKWKVNLTKLILTGLPSLYFSLSNFLMYYNNTVLHSTIAYPLARFLWFGTGYVVLFQLILGYILITSFYKVTGENE
jgi:hypothetical protein